MKAKHKTPLLLLLFAIILLLIAFASCKKSNAIPSKGKLLVLSSFEKQKATADNVFSLRLFNQLNAANVTNANLFASPLSVSFALGMTSNGANGATLDAFKNTLNFSGLAQGQVNAYYNNLITNLPQLEPNTTFKIANSIWYKKELTVLPQFAATNSNYFHAEVQGLDFSNASAAATINDWVNNATNGNIPSIINKINPDDVMYLINAIYFKSYWAEKFNTSDTKKQDFHKADGSTVQTDFMNGSLDFNYYLDPELTAVELPYSNDVFSMVLVMPGENKTLKNLTATLDSAKWNAITRNLTPIKSKVSLPKFTFSYDASLKDPLINMGLGLAFSNDADLSGINGAKGLRVTDAIHKAFIAVDENGTTAAAATSVTVGTTAAPLYNFTFNQPFVFIIREKHSGLILFIGTMNNPN